MAEHEQQPADEVIAAGEHMDLDAQAEALEAEKRAGAVNPTGYVAHAPSAKTNPYMSEEEQGMELTPKVFGPPQYGSPDPATAAGKLATLDDGHPLEGLPEDHPAAISEDYGADVLEGGRAEAESDEIEATDAAKELAAENDVDLAEVKGTGEDGKVLKGDVEDYIADRDADND